MCKALVYYRIGFRDNNFATLLDFGAVGSFGPGTRLLLQLTGVDGYTANCANHSICFRLPGVGNAQGFENPLQGSCFAAETI